MKKDFSEKTTFYITISLFIGIFIIPFISFFGFDVNELNPFNNGQKVEVTFEADSKRLSIHEIKQLAEKYIKSSSSLHGYMGMDYYSNLSNPDKGLFSFYVAVCYGSSENDCSYENVYLYTKNYGATWLIDFQ